MVIDRARGDRTVPHSAQESIPFQRMFPDGICRVTVSYTHLTFNFLISMIYTQLFNLLCEKADDIYGGRLPVHVRCLIDELSLIHI